ncbi:T9SS type A sorting domain-containing protein [Bacteroidota bacterium]
MKKTLTLLLTVFMGVSALMGQLPHALEKVTEAEVDYWVINNLGDFFWLCDTSSTALDADMDGTADFDSLEAKLDANYRLGADIVFNPNPQLVDWNNDGTVGGSDSLGLWNIGGDPSPNFSGHFDGQYFTIENVYKRCVNSERQRVALFGSVNGCIIENFYLKNFDFSNNEDYGGAIAARATYGLPNIFRRIKVEGTYDHSARSGALHNGGIVGRTKYTDVIECVSIMNGIAAIDGGNRFGALVGTLGDSSFIRNSYSVSTFAAKEKVGQVVGYYEGTFESAIENCYAAGVVTGADPPDSEIGSFAGNLQSLVPVSCYWDSDLNAIGVGQPDAAEGVTGLATTGFSTEANFVGWDFTSTWEMGTVEGVARPILQWQALLDKSPAVSVKDIDTRQLIQVYPNPVSTYLTLENAPVNAEYRLINMVGQTQESGIVRSKRMILNLAKYEQGFYLLKVGDNVSKILVK